MEKFLTFKSTNTADFGTQEQEAFTSMLGSGRAHLTANLQTETTSFAVSFQNFALKGLNRRMFFLEFFLPKLKLIRIPVLIDLKAQL